MWPALVLCGVEQVLLQPGRMAASAFDFVHYPWTHSLVMAMVWGVVFGVVYFALRKDTRAAIVVGLLVPSHWFLDLLVHGPDLPVWPAGPKLGLGGWNSVPVTLALEATFFVGSLVLYARTTTAKDRIGRWAFVGYVAMLVVIYVGVVFGPVPTDVKGAAGGALVMWLLVPWAAWFDRHRAAR